MGESGVGGNGRLARSRIWLSGSVPDAVEPADAERIAKFVRMFARSAFAQGFTIVHGSHPSITPVLLDEARLFHDRTGAKAPLKLLVSEFFVRDSDRVHGGTANEGAPYVEPAVVIPAVPRDALGERRARDRSLTLLRRELANQAHVIVAVGGNWWKGKNQPTGVPEEIELARDFRLPLFLLGGLGGATAAYLGQHPEYLAICQNGLSDAENLQLASTTDIEWIVGTILRTITADYAPTDRAVTEAKDAGPVRHDGGAARSFANQGIPEVFAGIPNDDEGPPFYRILCLDGGGIRGTFSAKVLAAWEQASGEKIIEHFDLIVGTSTGGILAIGLGMGMSPADMVRFYQEEGPRIFPGGGIAGKLLELKQWVAAKFDRNVLRESLVRAFASAPVQSDLLADSLVRLAITAYNAETDTPTVFRTPHVDFGRLDEHCSRLDVALATSAAPTYFEPTQVDHAQAVDGGLWANSPTAVALAEAALLKWDLSKVRILSIGTLFTPNVLAQPLKLDAAFLQATLQPFIGRFRAWILATFLLGKAHAVTGKLGWLPTIASLLMKTQAQAAEHVCRNLLGSRYLRVDMAAPAIPMDDAASINALLGYGDWAARYHYDRVKDEFLLSNHKVSRWERLPAGSPKS